MHIGCKCLFKALPAAVYTDESFWRELILTVQTWTDTSLARRICPFPSLSFKQAPNTILHERNEAPDLCFIEIHVDVRQTTSQIFHLVSFLSTGAIICSTSTNERSGSLPRRIDYDHVWSHERRTRLTSLNRTNNHYAGLLNIIGNSRKMWHKKWRKQIVPKCLPTPVVWHLAAYYIFKYQLDANWC